jgi:hypothetical protein
LRDSGQLLTQELVNLPSRIAHTATFRGLDDWNGGLGSIGNRPPNHRPPGRGPMAQGDGSDAGGSAAKRLPAGAPRSSTPVGARHLDARRSPPGSRRWSPSPLHNPNALSPDERAHRGLSSLSSAKRRAPGGSYALRIRRSSGCSAPLWRSCGLAPRECRAPSQRASPGRGLLYLSVFSGPGESDNGETV